MLVKSKISQIKSLSDKKERLATNCFVCEGEKLVGEVLGSNLKVLEVYATDQASEMVLGSEFTQQVSQSEMSRITHLKTATSALAIVEIPQYSIDSQKVKSSLNLVLDDVQDPGNLGTIIRIADWFGIEDIFCSPLTADCYNPKVVQATMGAITRVRIHYVDLNALFRDYASAEMPVYGTFLEGEPIYGAELSTRGFIVMGNEGRGVSTDVSRWVTNKLYIPPYPVDEPSSESLNVAVATAITCSEFRRR